MLWDRIIGHETVKISLRKSVADGTVGHAYLFTGPSSVGKSMVAKTLAASMICPDDGCGECNACRKILEDKHPDVRVVKPAGKNIPVETIRELRLDSFKKPVESERKVYIIKNAERMWEEGASTLLKVLEEPAENVTFILITASPGAVLPTIRSRCREVKFSRVPVAEMKSYLESEKGISGERLELIVSLSGGILNRAIGYVEEPWRLNRRDTVITVARELRRADLNRTLQMAQELREEILMPLKRIEDGYDSKKLELDDGSIDTGTLRSLLKSLDEERKREKIKNEIKGVKEVFSMLGWWFRDILVFKEGAGRSLLVNRDMEVEIAEEAESLPVESIMGCIDLVSESIKAVERNVPLQLNIESTLFGIQVALNA
ncbi:MAG: DNA polymerase III subunit delta' [Actinobacteria bacterium]|nr:DNA polymerase III subunit delta' [Actinomycetota bacterium]